VRQRRGGFVPSRFRRIVDLRTHPLDTWSLSSYGSLLGWVGPWLWGPPEVAGPVGPAARGRCSFGPTWACTGRPKEFVTEFPGEVSSPAIGWWRSSMFAALGPQLLAGRIGRRRVAIGRDGSWRWIPSMSYSSPVYAGARPHLVSSGTRGCPRELEIGPWLRSGSTEGGRPENCGAGHPEVV